jgi:hypothetical protein
MAMRTHDLPSGRLKNNFDEFDVTMYQGADGLFEIIFCIPGIEESDMDEGA